MSDLRDGAWLPLTRQHALALPIPLADDGLKWDIDQRHRGLGGNDPAGALILVVSAYAGQEAEVVARRGGHKQPLQLPPRSGGIRICVWEAIEGL